MCVCVCVCVCNNRVNTFILGIAECDNSHSLVDHLAEAVSFIRELRPASVQADLKDGSHETTSRLQERGEGEGQGAEETLNCSNYQ